MSFWGQDETQKCRQCGMGPILCRCLLKEPYRSYQRFRSSEVPPRSQEDFLTPNHATMLTKAMNSQIPGVCGMVMLVIKADRENKLIGFRDCQTTFTPRGLARKLCSKSASLDVSLYTIVPLAYQNVAPNCHIGDDGKFTNPSVAKTFTRKILGHSFPQGSPNPFRKWLRP